MNDLQRTDEWFLARKGMLTASEIVNIMGKGRAKGDIFSKTALSYMDGKIAERCMPDDMYLYFTNEMKRSTAAMKWGTDYESKAREVYEGEHGVNVLDWTFTPLPEYEDYVGGSPDGRLVTLDRIIEIKCPYNPAVHIEHCRWETGEDLANGNPQYFAQVQLNMMVTGTDVCDFISYSPLFFPYAALHVTEVRRDPDYCNQLLDRIDLAVEYIKEQEQKIKSNFIA